MEKPTLAKGTRDFGPATMAKRQFILNNIRAVFQKFGFQLLETPAMENLSTLTGKYGDEGDQLLFKILNSGDYLKDANFKNLEAKDSKKLTSDISEKGLRYDLTVPFARYVVMNRGEITFPFKRYQIQPVWRADRPQKGRYREFYQCDADVVGTASLICEVEIILMIKEVFNRLSVTDYTIKFNHRGILSGIAEVIGAKENESSLFVAIDKLDKIGEDKVREELLTKGFIENNLDGLFDMLNLKGSTRNKLAFLASRFDGSASGKKGLRDIQEVLNLLTHFDATEDHIEFDVALARGLSYYTGCIFEVKINNSGLGSVSGGGRYDNLTTSFGDKDNLSGVGFSFGVDRLYDALEVLQLFPKEAQVSSKVLICHFDESNQIYGLKVLSQLRAAGISAEVYPDVSKIKKQMDYANKKMIAYTIIIGSDEMQSELLSIKDLQTGEQEKLNVEDIIKKLSH
ncbi:MAG: histidine--tRNA ligase [Chryseolinea sp.]